MGQLKAVMKRFVIGRPGLVPHAIRRGLLRGLAFHIDAATKSQRVLGLDEAEITSAIRRLTADAGSALDIGANDGWYSLYFASRPNIERVIAFEPCQALMGRVQENFALNDPTFAEKLSCMNTFVGTTDDENWCTVDSVVNDLPRPILLKIDVDGGELDVLRGGRRLLESGQALLVIETHSKDLEDDCFALLADFGYEVRVVRNAWYRWLIPEARPLIHNRWLVASPNVRR